MPTHPHNVAPQPEPLTLACRDISRGIKRAIDLAEAEGLRTVLTRRGSPTCAIVPLGDLALLELLTASTSTAAAPPVPTEPRPGQAEGAGAHTDASAPSPRPSALSRSEAP